MRKRMRIHIPLQATGTKIALALMSLSALIRLVHYLPGELTAEIIWIHLFLPVAAVVVFLAGTIAGERWIKPASLVSVALGVTFFILKAMTFTPVHQTLCTILYLTVLVLYVLTVLGYLPTKKLLYLLFGLPLVYHILVEDTRLYFFADPPVPVCSGCRR